MNEQYDPQHPDSLAPTDGAEAQTSADLLTSGGDSPAVIEIEVHMKPERVFGLNDDDDGGKAEKKGRPGRPAESGVSKKYRTTSWFFASDFLDRLAEIAADDCRGLRVRPAKVEISFALDDKAYRHVDLIVESVDEAFRAL